jgi:signal transduction histidine kinase/CheY-like chemotaxis protein
VLGPHTADDPLDVLAVPLVTREGRNLGLIQVSRAAPAHFTDEDEDLLLQLARMTSIAIENTLFSEAREANRLKDEFLATVSHELRTPLNALRSWAWLLRGGKLAPEKMARAADAIERNVIAQSRIVDDLLDVSRIVTGKLRLNSRDLQLEPIIETAIESVIGDAEAKGIGVTRFFDPEAGAVLGDAERLQQVVWNLLSNAVKFTPRGGRVDVYLDRIGAEVRVRVADTGQGIAPDFLPYVFERFRQADASSTRSSGGLGLGLAIVRHLVELHGGSICVESPGEAQGATFTFTLPAAPCAGGVADASAPVASEADSASESAGCLGGLRVLIVEDEVDTRDALALMISEAGGRVTTVGSASDALRALAASRPDVLVCDIGLPVEDGYTLIRKVRLQDDGGLPIPAVALTAYAQESDRQRSLAAGFQSHLAKPVDPAKLLQVLADAAPGVRDARERGEVRPGGSAAPPPETARDFATPPRA